MPDFDAIVIGTGFAGAVTACRLVQAGQNICVLERGRRYEANDFPTPLSETAADAGSEQNYVPPPDFSRWTWANGQGLWDLRDLDQVIAGQAAGYGGGSLIYANVHLRAPAEVFEQLEEKEEEQGTNGSRRLWPANYTRKKLNPYYDLVAHKLQVAQIPPDKLVPKTNQLEHAAADLGHKTFRPPLAINFDKCDLRGDCCIGCGAGAKNTLDHNYLRDVEAAAFDDAEQSHKKEYLADIRTLAEAKKLERVDGGFEVTYVDHLLGGTEKPITGKYVFLCAGVVNTTELLLRNRKSLKLNSDQLGEGYYPNLDSIAAVFDCDEIQEPSRGPTITSSFLYHHENPHSDRKDWILVQDGGLPADLEPLLGIFRSPLWMRRNRYLEHDTAVRRERPVRRAPVAAAVNALGFVPGRSAPQQDALHAAVRQTGFIPSVDQPFLGLGDPAFRNRFPGWLVEALDADRDQLFDYADRLSEPILRKVLDEITKRVDTQLNVDDLIRAVGLEQEQLQADNVNQSDLARGFVRLLAQLVWGSEADMSREVVKVLRGMLPKTLAELPDALSSLIGWALDYRPPNGRTAMLLTMGRDRLPGRLYLNGGADTELVAALPKPHRSITRLTQERLLRDIAKQWRGELRTNPTWPFLRRRLTVHSQGGCPMACVTGSDGQLYDCKGLYVMDAAAFPSPVGVNPSATIAAIAEYKIEKFIEKLLKDPGEQRNEQLERFSDEQKKRKEEATAWANNRRKELEPPALVSHNDEPLTSDPVSLEFKETMRGYHDKPNQKHVIEWTDPSANVNAALRDRVQEFITDFDKAEIEGIDSLAKIEVRLNAHIADLTLFLERHKAKDQKAKENPRIAITGELEITGWPNSRQSTFILSEQSCLQLFLGDLPGIKTFRYDLFFDHDSELHALSGIKILRDEPRFDLWEDTATLYFDILRNADKNAETIRRGILRLPADNFLNDQLRSFKVSGTEDPARQSWALAAFTKLFFGHLTDIYAPELDRVGQLIKNILVRTHA